MKKKSFWQVVFCALPLMTAGCFVAQPDIQNPIERKMGWFTYLAGDDMAASCQPTSPTKIRVINNVGYYDHVGAYNLTFLSKGDAILVSDRFGRVNFVNLSVSDPLKPARGIQKSVNLSRENAETLKQVVTTSRLFTSDFDTMRAWSAQHYRVFMLCDQGKMSFYADKFPWNENDAGQAATALFDLIQALDPIDIDFPASKKVIVNGSGMPSEKSVYDDTDDHFVSSFDRNGYAWF